MSTAGAAGADGKQVVGLGTILYKDPGVFPYKALLVYPVTFALVVYIWMAWRAGSLTKGWLDFSRLTSTGAALVISLLVVTLATWKGFVVCEYGVAGYMRVLGPGNPSFRVLYGQLVATSVRTVDDLKALRKEYGDPARVSGQGWSPNSWADGPGVAFLGLSRMRDAAGRTQTVAPGALYSCYSHPTRDGDAVALAILDAMARGGYPGVRELAQSRSLSYEDPVWQRFLTDRRLAEPAADAPANPDPSRVVGDALLIGQPSHVPAGYTDPGRTVVTDAGAQDYPKNGLGTWSLILGLASVATAVFYGAGILVAVAAIVLGVMGLKAYQNGLAKSRGKALAGVFIAQLGLVVGAIAAIIEWYMLRR